MNNLFAQQADGSTLVIGDEVLSTMWGYVQHRSRDKEAGGLIIGQFLEGENTYILDKVTRPMKGDTRSRFGFFRNQKTHQSVLDREWESSDRSRTYFGEWHTHPERTPTPSPTDISSWRSKLIHPQMVVPRLYFIIVGQSKTIIWFGECGFDAIEQVAILSTGVSINE